jgi:hypothetical protein
MRKFLIPLLAATALAVPSAAQADGSHNYPSPPPPAPVTLPTSVTNETEANNYVRAYVALNVGNITQTNLQGRFDRGHRRVTLSNIATACLQHPVVAARFGCVFRFNVEIRDNDRSGRNDRGYRRFKGGGDDNDNWGNWNGRDRNRDRVQNLGCLGAIRINAGPGATPVAQVVFADCVRRDRRS